MTNEEIFDTAEFYGWQDDFGRWNFTDEGLINFALDLLQTGGTSEDVPTKCKDHPDAPHGFDRNASHNADRYVCECESWEPEEKNT